MEKIKDLAINLILLINNRTGGYYYFSKNGSGEIVVHNCRTNGVRFYTKNEFLQWYMY